VKECRLLLFAKVPQLGRVKTRMNPFLTEVQSLHLHTALMRHVATAISDWPNGTVQLHYALDPCEKINQNQSDKRPFILAKTLGLQLLPQVEGDLGMKMAAAVLSNLQDETHCDSVILLGADCPFLTLQHCLELRDALRVGCQAALIPALDGGYVALALNCYDRQLFCDIDWGSDRVLQQTIKVLQGLGWRYQLLPALADIDRPEDLVRLKPLKNVYLQAFAQIAG